MYIRKSAVNQERELPEGAERFCLQLPCRNRPMIAENRCLYHEPQHPENKDNTRIKTMDSSNLVLSHKRSL